MKLGKHGFEKFRHAKREMQMDNTFETAMATTGLLMSLNIQLLSEIVMDNSSLLTALQNKGGLPTVTKYCLKYLSRITGKVITENIGKKKDLEEEEEEKKEKEEQEEEEEEQEQEQEQEEELIAETGWDGNSQD
ncbi:hypothetical protein DUI87_16411 [Hirundo rustica rustica]|uniref:Uncharacterized protein n=1 Tax=Hirundo rustica rustica TaxID=333673 RepID=A0A3M0K0Z9_HIRRU|nr:hypothetical protein DUI87_16411 [Hirundo rustica rustica]